MISVNEMMQNYFWNFIVAKSNSTLDKTMKDNIHLLEEPALKH